ncbi:MAG: hypothetical protein ACRET4_15940, partial [Steroidobacteraceae bacterium]
GVHRLERPSSLGQVMRERRRGFISPQRAVRALRNWLRPAVPLPPSMETKAATLTVEACNRFFYRVQHDMEHFAGLFAGHPVLPVWFEDMIADRTSVFDTVESFLDVPRAPLAVATVRQNPEPLSELIENYEELRVAFRDTAAAPFFE